MQKLSFRTGKRNEIVDVTNEIKDFVKKSGVKSGICVLFCPHTTAGLTINENYDPAVKGDILFSLDKISPNYREFMHTEQNSDAHVKASLMGQSITFIINEGELMIGRWQGIYFTEFDGPRPREIWFEFVEK